MTQPNTISSKITLTVPTAAGKVYKHELRGQIGANRHEWRSFVREFLEKENSYKKEYEKNYLSDKKVSAPIAKAMLLFNFEFCLGYESVEINFTVRQT